MSYEMKMTTCELQFGLCFCGMFSVSDLTGCHSIFPSRKPAYFCNLLSAYGIFVDLQYLIWGFSTPVLLTFGAQISLFLWSYPMCCSERQQYVCSMLRHLLFLPHPKWLIKSSILLQRSLGKYLFLYPLMLPVIFSVSSVAQLCPTLCDP